MDSSYKFLECINVLEFQSEVRTEVECSNIQFLLEIEFLELTCVDIFFTSTAVPVYIFKGKLTDLILFIAGPDIF